MYHNNQVLCFQNLRHDWNHEFSGSFVWNQGFVTNLWSHLKVSTNRYSQSNQVAEAEERAEQVEEAEEGSQGSKSPQRVSIKCIQKDFKSQVSRCTSFKCNGRRKHIWNTLLTGSQTSQNEGLISMNFFMISICSKTQDIIWGYIFAFKDTWVNWNYNWIFNA